MYVLIKKEEPAIKIDYLITESIKLRFKIIKPDLNL
jgi:hypothetical protein